MKGLIQDFKKFALKGNAFDLAVGVIIGAAFGKIVSSLVDDIIMPIVGVVMGGVNFTSLSINIGKSVITYGNFIQNVVDFVIIALCVFLMVKAMNKLLHKNEAPAKPAGPSNEEKLLAEIRDLLKDKK